MENNTVVEFTNAGPTSVEIGDSVQVTLEKQEIVVNVAQGTVAPDVVIETGFQGPQGPRGISVESIAAYGHGYVKVTFTDGTSHVVKLPETVIVTTGKLPVVQNKAKLPSACVGDIVFNMAQMFSSSDSMVIMKEVLVSTDGSNVVFKNEDEVNGMFCVVSYLTFKD